MQYELPSGNILRGTDAQYVQKLEDDLYYSRKYVDYMLKLSTDQHIKAIEKLRNIDEKDELRKKGLI